jgi:hypothetical protein
MQKRIVGTVFMVLLSAAPLRADMIHLKNGGTLEGVILKKDEDGVVVLLKYATVTIESFDIESIEKYVRASDPSGCRMAGWQTAFQALADRPWGSELHLLPSPVIDSGALKNVPYVLFASGEYEFALYGDPETPASFEVGVSGTLMLNEAARKDCLNLIASLLRSSEDAKVLRSLTFKGEKKELDGLVFEIDREPNALGKETWWISVTDLKALDAARVSDKQLESMTTAEPPQAPRNPTLVEGKKGSGAPQELITPFGTEPEKPRNKRRSYSGRGGYWGGHIRWNHGHAGGTPPPKPVKKLSHVRPHWRDPG